MNDAEATVHGQVSVARRVDQLCDRFEAAWKAGPSPRVEDYLDGVTGEERRALLRELIPLEVDYRLHAGESPTPSEYKQRFPDEMELVRVLFREVAKVRTTNLRRDTPALAPLPTQRDQDRPSPTAVAGHEILGVLGRGGMGVVYKARQVALNRLVALKMIHAGQAGPEQRSRFLAEARAVARLQHPNIVQIHEVGEHDGQPFLALEFAEGGSLADHLNTTRLSARQAAELLETLARAVHAAHERGIVHRDLTPANVLLTADGVPKIADFGLAKFVGPGPTPEAGPTLTGVIVGTPSYMSPEQASGRSKEIGPLADVYALGAILYEVLTGRPPFRGATVLETLHMVRDREPVPPRRLTPRLPRDLETICLKCLRKEPHQRYASAWALAEDLRRFLDYEPIQARPIPRWRILFRQIWRRPATSALVVLLVVGILVGLGWAYQVRTEQARALQKRQDAFQILAAQGRDAVRRGDWPQAEFQWELALRDESPGAGFVAEVDRLRDELDLLRQARARLGQFGRLRDTAFFTVTLALDLDPAAHAGRAERAAREALALFGVDLDRGSGPVLPDRYLSGPEKSEVEEGCYQLLLVLADLVASPRTGKDSPVQAGQALHLLDVAAGLTRRSEALRDGPGRAYHLRRARCLEQRGDPAGAAQERERAKGRPPASALDFFLLGHEYLFQGGPADRERALEAFQQALRRQPDHFWAQYFLAVGYLQGPRPRPELARAYLNACLSRRTDFPWLHLLLGFVQSELGDFDAAAAAFRQVGDGPEEVQYALLVNRGVLRLRQAEAVVSSVPVLQTVALLTPAGLVPAGLAQVCRQHCLAEAIDDFTQARTLQPREWMTCVNLARAYRKQDRVAEALEQLDQAIHLAPDRAVLYRERARAHLQCQNSRGARRDLEEALRRELALGSSRAQADDLVELGRVLLQGPHAEDAVAVCDRALAVWPDHLPAHRLRAQALLRLERHPEALRSLDRCARLGNAPAEVYRARGQVRAKLGDYQGAATDYTFALEREPSAALYAARGWVYLLASESPGWALADFEEVLRRDPTNGDACNGRGFARVLLGQTRAGIADAEEAFRRGPEDSRLDFNAARIYARAISVEDSRGGLSSPAGLEIRERWQSRAVQLLRRALERTPAPQRAAFWHDYVGVDAAFQSIRRSPPFARLAAEVPAEAR